MIDPNARAIARIKLAELRRQRDWLITHYDAVEAAAAGAAAPLDRLKILYDGLRNAKFGGRSLHPEVANLEVLLLEGDLGAASSEMIEGWLQRLQKEMDHGRLRAEFAFGFGWLLDDWVAAVDAAGPQGEERADPIEDKLRGLWEPEEEKLDLEMLRGMFQAYPADFARVRKEIQSFAAGGACARVSSEEVKGLLKSVSNDITRTPDLRRQAMVLAADEMQVNEYVGALTVQLNNLSTWDWPDQGFPIRSLWSRTKWRPYLDVDLFSLLFQQLIGFRWGSMLKKVFNAVINDFSNDAIFGQPKSAGLSTPIGLRRQQYAQLFLPMIPDNIEQLANKGGYDGGSDGSGIMLEEIDTAQQLLVFLNTEIQLARASHPEDPLFVLQSDLRDYYLRIPHGVILCLLENLEMPEPWFTFFRKSLAAPVSYRGQAHRIGRGLLLDHPFSDVMANFLLLFLDIHVWRTAGIRPIRLVDDFFLVAETETAALQSWGAVQEFCRALGLSINAGRSGAVSMGGQVPPELPAGPPRWGMLELRGDGSWGLHQQSIEEFQTQVGQQLSRESSLLTRVSLYNASVRYLLKFLGLHVPLGPMHRKEIEGALASFGGSMLDGLGMVEGLQAQFASQLKSPAIRRIPEALLYWPITAGGLGLFDPLLAAAAFHGPALQHTPLTTPAVEVNLMDYQSPWRQWYSESLRPLTAATPVSTPGMQPLLEDFAARSKEVAGESTERAGSARTNRPGHEVNLGIYWQWIVYTYGPQILDSLGTFRFLITELVPLQLIVQNRIDSSSLRPVGPS